MKGFNFKLQSVLKLKDKKLEDERLIMGEILKLLEEQKNILEEMKTKKTNLEKELLASLENSDIDILLVQNYRGYISNLLNDIKTQEDIIEKTKTNLEVQKLKVNEAYKEVKVLEKLREKQEKKFIQEQTQKEIKELDDITISRYKKAI